MTLRKLVVCVIALAGCGGDSKPADQDPDADAGPSEQDMPSIVGAVWHDGDGDGALDDGEEPLEGRDVYLDSNDNGVLDDGERTARTGADGRYAFDELAPGDYVVRQRMSFGWRGVSGGAPAPSAARHARARRPGRDYRIIGGDDAAIAAYPFMVAVGSLDGGQVYQFCGGALISDRWVVTAAHCTDGQPAGVGALLGTDDLAAGGQVFAIASQHSHPDGDLALWELTEPVDLAGSDIATVELASPGTEPFTSAGALATAIGWGVGAPGTVLQQVHVPIVSHADCQASYPESVIAEHEICAGVPEGGIDSCQGDSGGPLLVRDSARELWLHAGVTSWGEGCALPGKPGVYARSSVLSGWAEEVATEPSRVHRVTVDTGAVTADFGLVATTRPMTGAIAARWQITGVQAPETVAAGAPVDVSWRLIDDGTASPAFACALDPDGPGAEVALPAPCAAGDNSYSYAGYADGVYMLRLTVTASGTELARESLVIAGTPATDERTGELTADDPVDPDWPGSRYRIDYYEVTAAAPGRVALIELESSAFTPYLALYDADARTPDGGGLLATSGGRLALVPEDGKRYLVGVSSFGEDETGAYAVRLLNNGTLTATTLE